MSTEHHDRDDRIADAILAMADDETRLTPPPASLWGRIERAVGEPTGAPVVDAGGPEPTPSDLWDRIAGEVRADPGPLAPEPTHPRRRTRTLALVAAALLVVCALAATALVLRQGPGDPTSELVATASLSGEGLDPGGDGSGSAELLEGDGGWKVAIEVDRLPSAPPGTYYEAWLLGAGPGQVQSLGALEGDERFVVPDGLAIDDFPLVDVSIEPIDGNPGHSSKSVLRGELETA